MGLFASPLAGYLAKFLDLFALLKLYLLNMGQLSNHNKGEGEDSPTPEEEKAMLENGRSDGFEVVPLKQIEGFTAAEKEPLSDEEVAVVGAKDKYQLVYIIFLLHGIGILMPWNMFITAHGYFIDYKLRGPCDQPESEYRKFFMNFLGIVAQLPNVLLNVINLFVHLGGDIKSRIVWSIVTMIITFVFTIIMAMVDSSQWIEAFFWLTMVSVVILNAATGVYQNSLYGLVAILPPRYTNAVILGNNISGTITTVVSIVSKLAVSSTGTGQTDDDIRTSAIYYFLFALVMLLIAFDSYFALPLIKFFRENELKMEREKKKVEIENKESGVAVSTGPPYMAIMKRIWVQALSVWFVFFITLTNFPAIQYRVKPQEDSIFPEEFFEDITCFLAFNVMAVVGNFATEIVRWPGPKYVWVPVVLRALFVPFFLLCRYDLDHRMLFPALIHNDWIYFIGSILHGFTSGYFSSLCMMYAPTLVAPQYMGTAGMMSALFLVLGIFTGCLFSLLVGKLMLVDSGAIVRDVALAVTQNVTRHGC